METGTIVIKVKYGDTLRRFSASVLDQELDLNIDGLREKICLLFKIAPATQFTLTYIDEDGDVVTLVDNDDLHDVVRQALNPLRITVKLNAEKSSVPHAWSSGSSTPLRSADAQPSPQVLKSRVSEILKSVPQPLGETLTKLSTELASKAPGITELVDGFSKTGSSYISQLSGSGISGTTKDAATKIEDAGCSKVPPFTSEDLPTASKEQSLRSSAGLQELKPELIQESVEPTLKRDSAKEVNKPPLPHFGPKQHNVGSPFRFPGNPKYCSAGAGIKNMLHSPIRKSRVSHLGPCFVNECPFAGIPVGSDSDLPLEFGPHGFPFIRSNNQNEGVAGIFHRGIRCDGCGAHPITGTRFQSKVKEDYDLCSVCFAEKGNDTDYIVYDRPAVINGPVPYRPSFTYNKGTRYSFHGPPPIPQGLRGKVEAPFKLESRFIQDVNVPDGTAMAPLTPFTKIWRIRNSGTLPWPRQTKLLWIGGDKFSDACSVEVEIPAFGLAMDQELDVAVDFVAPELPGRYISYWRMASPSGQKFGQRVWVLIQVSTSVTERYCESDLNLNLPPVSNVLSGPGIIQVGTEPAVDKCNEPDSSNKIAEFGQPVVEVQRNPEDLKANNNSFLVGDGSASLVSVTPASSGSRPIIDLSEVESALLHPTPTPTPTPTPPVVASTASRAVVDAQVEDKEKNEVEEKLLRELEDMGFKQVDLNKEVLRTNEYDLEQSVDELCGVSEWDPMLEELQEMGFHDMEINKKLLKKNNGSIKRVVMDLITGEK